MPAAMNVGTFHGRFGADEACRERLKMAHWEPNLERFIRPECDHAKGWRLVDRRLGRLSRGGPGWLRPSVGAVNFRLALAAVRMTGILRHGDAADEPRRYEKKKACTLRREAAWWLSTG